MANTCWLVVALAACQARSEVDSGLAAVHLASSAPGRAEVAPSASSASSGTNVAGAGIGLGGPISSWGPIDPDRLPVVVGAAARRRPPPPPARVRIGDPTADGPLDRGIVRRVLRRNLARFEYCYQRELLGTPGLAGAIELFFVIDADGRASVIDASGLAGELAQCARTVVEQLRFPRPRGGGVVRARFALTVTQDADDAPRPGPPPRRRPARPRRAGLSP